MRVNRRKFLAGTAAIAGAAAFPMPSIAQAKGVKIGLLTVKTGPLAEGGFQMEQGVTTYLKSKNMSLAGHKVELVVADTGGNPAGTKTKAQELVERDHVNFILGPLAAFEMLAISDYVVQNKMPTLCLAGADNLTQRQPNAFLTRASATSSQAMHVMGDYAAKVMGLKKVVCLDSDFAFGYEQQGGFQQVFEDDGGKVVKKIWAPLGAPDFTPFIAQIQGADGVCQGYAGAAPVKFMKQYADVGLKLPVVGGETAGDDALLPRFGDEAIGMINACPYTIDLKNDANDKFKALMQKEYQAVPGFYAASMYVTVQVVEAALRALHGDLSKPAQTVKALRAVSLKETARGPIRFDHLGNVVGDIFVRKIVKEGGKLTNVTQKTYHNVSQFWTYNEAKYLAQPAYSRDYPPVKA
ncbi:MAG: ABC transporter substrate-binding protein [Alphaproteobacteria bacterium]|nr:ABC transporter substrate-binding protein [Alphaproteobacteria bacterium]